MDVNDIDERDTFHQSFIAAARWQGLDDDGHTFDNLQFSEEAINTMVDNCNAFMADHAAELVHFSANEAGHCFALSANSHGAGFLDHFGGPVHREARKLSDGSNPYAYNVWTRGGPDSVLEVE